MIKPTAHYLRPRSRICLLYRQENLGRNEELQNLSVDLEKRLCLLLPKYTGLGSVVCVAFYSVVFHRQEEICVYKQYPFQKV